MVSALHLSYGIIKHCTYMSLMYLATIQLYNIQHIAAAAAASAVGPLELRSRREMEQYIHDHDVAIFVPGNYWCHQQWRS